MINNVEKQTVQMEFDNKNFEKNVDTSLSTLDKLKVGLSTLATGAGGISVFANQIKSITFDPINSGVQMGIGKVMALTAALTGVVNITDALYQKVTSTVKALSVDQISAGFAKYEDKTASVQTIMSAVRKEGEADEEVMERVQEQLEKLNWFTDETSYNFTDMVANIGKFTSQGIELEKSVTAMQGIATWAAKSGQGTAEASRAMYNLSQAMGTGAVKLMDWKSIENANMATKEFKEQAMEAAVAAGTLRKEGDKYVDVLKNEEVSIQNFNQTLASGWFSSDVLMDVLNKYGSYADMVHEMQEEDETAAETMERMKTEGLEAGNELAASAFKAAQEAKTFTEAIEATQDAVSTAFLNIFENLFGNYLEAKELWTDFANLLYDAFAAPIVALSDLTKEWKDQEGGGREKLLKSLTRIVETLTSVFEKFSEVFSKFFGTIDDKLPLANDITQKIDLISIYFSNLMNELIENENIWENLEKLLHGIRRAFDFVKVSLSTLIDKVFKPIFIKWLPVGVDKFSDLIGKFGDFIYYLSNEAIKFNPVAKGIEIITDNLGFLIAKLEEFFGLKDEGENNPVSVLSKNITEIKNLPKELEPAIDFFIKLKEFGGKVGEFIGQVISHVSPIFASVWNFAKSFFKWIVEMVKGIGPALKTAGDFIKKSLDKITSFLDTFVETTKKSDKNAFELMAELIASGIQYLMDKLKGVDLDRLNGWLDAIEKIVRIVAEIVAIWQLISDGSISIGGSIELPFSGVLDSISELSEKMGKAKKTEATAALIESLAIALVAIAGALLLISFIPADRLLDSVFAFAALVTIFTIAIGAIELLFTKLMSGSPAQRSIMSTVGLDTISERLFMMSIFIASIGAAILMLTGALAIIAKLDWKDALEGLAGIVALMASLIGTAYSLKGIDDAAKLVGVGIAMIIISSAIDIIALAVAKMSKTKDVVQGLVAIGDLLITMVGALYALSGLKNLKSVLAGSVAIVILSIALQKIVKAVTKLAKIQDTDKMVLAVVMVSAIMGYMLMLAGLASALNNSSSILAVSAAMIVISLAVSNIAKVVEDICRIDNPELITKTLIQLGAMATALVGLVAILVGLSQLLMNKATKTLDMSKVASLAIVTGVMLAMIIPITAIAKSLTDMASAIPDSSSLLGAAGAIGIVFSAIALVMALASRFSGKQVVSILGIALAIDMLAAALLALTPSLVALSTIDAGNFAAVIGTVALVTALLLEALKLIGGTDQLLKIGLVIDMIAVAAIACAAALYLLAEAIDKFAKTIVFIANVGPDVWQNFFDNLTIATTQFLTGLFPLFLKAFDSVITNVISSILTHAAEVTQATVILVDAVVKALVTALEKYIPNIISALDTLITLLGPLILDKLNPFIWDFLDDVIVMLNDLIPKLNEHLEIITWDLLLRILRILHDYIPMLNEELAYEGDNLIHWVNWLLKRLTLVILQGTIDILTMIRDHIDEIIALTVEIGTQVVLGFLEGLIMTIPLLYEKTLQVLDELLDLINRVLDADWDKIYETLEKLANKTVEVANKWVVKESEAGGKISELVLNLLKGLAKALWYHTTHSVFTPIGLGTFIGNKITEGLKKKLEIHSPSKVMEKIGGYVMDGMGKGIEKGKETLSPIISNLADIVKTNFSKHFGSLSDITSGIGDSLIGGMRSELGGLDFASIMGDFTNLNPTITPNLDLSQIKAGAMGLDSMFASEQLNGFIDYSGAMKMDSVTQTDQMNKMMDQMSKYMAVQAYDKAAPTEVNVVLDGDAKKMLKVLKVENNKQEKAK